MLCLLQILLLFPLIHYGGHIILARKTLSRRITEYSIMVVSNFAAGLPLVQAHNSSYITPSAVGILNSSHSVNNVTTALPALFVNNSTDGSGVPTQKGLANYQDLKSGFCAIGDDFCSFKDSNGTIHGANPTNFSDQCLLWDDSCSGNRTMAIKGFFDIAFSNSILGDRIWNGNLLDNDCFAQGYDFEQSDCDTYNPPERLLEFQKIKDWMRSSQCVSAANEWVSMTGNPWGYIFDGGLNESRADYVAKNAYGKQLDEFRSGSTYDNSSDAEPSCCGVCSLSSPNVDLYYWPEPEANSSCLSIIGESIRPLDYGATKTTTVYFGTTFDTGTYWGCEVTSSYPIEGHPGESSTEVEVMTTAVITTIGSLTVKISSYSPWSSPVCGEDDAGSQSSIKSTKFHERQASIYARGHSLVVPSSITNADGLPVSTVVSGDFTFTSPSVYANFYSLSATDDCGGSMIPSVMLSFSAGELSTMVGNLGMYQELPYAPRLTTQRFDFKDLPCPPQSVMEANWYKPQLGEPYRPLIAMPSQLKQGSPWFSYCRDGLFTAYDPPSALTAASALAPPNSPGNLNTLSSAPVPSPTMDSGVRQTVGTEGSAPVPASIPKVDQPKATMNTTPAPPQKEGSDGSPANDPATHENSPSQPNAVQPNSDPTAGSNPQQDNDPIQGSGNNGDSAHGADPKPKGDSKDNGSKQGSGNGGGDGHGADPKPNGDPDQVNSNQGSNHIADPVPQNDPKQTNFFYGFTAGQTMTINNQIVQPLSHGLSIAGTTLTRGAPPITVSGTPIDYGSSALVIGTSTRPLVHPAVKPLVTNIAGQTITAASNAVIIADDTLLPGDPPATINGTIISLDPTGHLIIGSKTVSLQSGQSTGVAEQTLGASNAGAAADALTTVIDGHTLTAAPTALAMAGTTLTPGAPGLTLNGTLVSLDTAARLVLGSQTVALEGAQSAGLGGLIMGAFGSGGPFGGPSSTGGNTSTGAADGTGGDDDVQVFEGNAVGRTGHGLWNEVAVSAIAVSVLLYVR